MLKSIYLVLLLNYFYEQSVVAQSIPSNEECNRLTYGVPASCVNCVKSCSISIEPFNNTCECETSRCKSASHNASYTSCHEEDKEEFSMYADDGCVLNKFEERCSSCVATGCSFCDRTYQHRDGDYSKGQHTISFCWDGKEEDGFYGECDRNEKDVIRKKYSSDEDEETICGQYVDIPIGVVLIYVIVYTICPMCCVGALFWTVCFGMPSFVRRLVCFGSSSPVGVDGDQQHDISSSLSSPWGQQQPGRSPNQMYVLPADTVPAVVSSLVTGGVQTAIVMNTARGGIVSEMTQMHTGSMTSNMSGSSNINYAAAAAAGGTEKDVPIAFAEPLHF